MNLCSKRTKTKLRVRHDMYKGNRPEKKYMCGARTPRIDVTVSLRKQKGISETSSTDETVEKWQSSKCVKGFGLLMPKGRRRGLN